ncbi:MAG: TIGR00366 family protein, partial [Myxococcales bacterium]|nr:TIGR00366 family protein [Myxococcales bacterium]
ATVLVSVVASCTALVHWGLGLIVGAVLAREVGRIANERGVPMHYPTLAAGGYSGLLVWHGGLSGSAPLKVTTAGDLTEVLGAELAAKVGTLPLTETLFSVRNMLVTAALVVVIPAVLTLLVPRDPAAYVRPPSDGAPVARDLDVGSPLDRGPWLVVPLVALMAAWVWRWAAAGGLASLSPNALNFVFFGVGLALAGSPTRYMQLAQRGATAATGILVQFPLYAGISGLLAGSGLGAWLASFGTSTLLASTFLSAGLLNLFVPSGGGQWGIQGPIAMAAAVEQGIEPARIVLAVAWGDQWTNAFQPFWALPLLGITGASASDLLSCTAIVGVAVGAVLFLGVVL